MSKLTKNQMAALEFLGERRGTRAATLSSHPDFKAMGSEQAVRKLLERLCESGYAAPFKLVRGQQLFRLSAKGAQLVGAPPAFAAQPTTNIAAEMLSASSLASECIFLKPGEITSLLASLAGREVSAKILVRLFIRRLTPEEDRIDFLLSELRTAEKLAARAHTVLAKLLEIPVLSELNDEKLLGVTIAVPSESFKVSLLSKSLPPLTTVEVVQDLQDLIIT